MNPITFAYIARAKAALDLAAPPSGASAADRFTLLAKAVFAVGAGHFGNLQVATRGTPIEGLCKAALTTEDFTDSAGYHELTSAFLTEVASANLIDTALRAGALPIPHRAPGAGAITVASGVIAEATGEGAPKVTAQVDISPGDLDYFKVASILVATSEVLRNPNVDPLLRLLLRDAVVKASNAALLANVPTSPISAGPTAVEALTAGLGAAANSLQYVVAATPAVARELALQADGRMGIGGGEYIPGVHVLPALEPDSSGARMVVIPASALAIEDSGLELRASREATVNFDGGPGLVSLYQTNSTALLVERLARIRASQPAIEVA